MSFNLQARYLAQRVTMMPRDTYGQGHIFGGVILSYIDLAGAIVARKACSGRRLHRVVTRAMDKIEFKHPVLVNDNISCYGTVTRLGKTSVSVHVEVEADRDGKIISVTEADLVFVAINSKGRPVPVQTRGRAGKTQPAGAAPIALVVAAPACAPVNSGSTSSAPVRTELPAQLPVISLMKEMLPFETNGMGNIFGGVLLSHMDLAGAYAARRFCANKYIRRCVTRFMDKVEFKQPVHVNDVLICKSVVTHIGNTSVSVHVEVEADRAGMMIPVTAADIVYVAVNDDWKPIPVSCTTASDAQGIKA